MWYEIVAILAGIAVFWMLNEPRYTDGYMSYFQSFRKEIVHLDGLTTTKLIGWAMTIMLCQVGVLIMALVLDQPIFATLAMMWSLFYWVTLFVAYHLQVSES